MLSGVSSDSTVARKFFADSETFGALRSLFFVREVMKQPLRIISEHRTRHPGGRNARPARRLPRPHRRALITDSEQPAPKDTPDFALIRAQEAGGPLDEASYACQCGYLFEASVSTTVTCPHCGASQAW
jgi:hypothetical protein